MEIFFVLLGFLIMLAVAASVIGGVIWLYRRLIGAPANSSITPLISSEPLEFPQNFSWALAVFLLGFQAGLYTWLSHLDAGRVPATGWLVFTLC
nr:hypothetical protein [Candidatus Woesebacteria bacterium]